MKRIIPILVVGVLLLGGLGAVALPEKNNENTFFSFSNIKSIEKDDFITLDLYGANSVVMESNHYMVPIRIETFTYPFGTTINSVKCTPRNIETQLLSKKIEVAKGPICISQPELNMEVEKVGNPIAVNTWFDYDVGTGINGDERYVFVKVVTYPIQYYPSEDKIEWAKNIDIDIDYILPSQPISFDDEYQFIVLAPDEYSDELSTLVSHKNGRGISTIFVSLTDITSGTYFPATGRDTQEKIKYFIKNAIENWGTSNVLLVGSSQKFPNRVTHVYIDGDNELFVSDLYYADIYNDTGGFSSWDTNNNDIFGEYKWSGKTDDVDLYPDVYLGRLACTNGVQVTSVVNKIITYETNEAYTQEWFTNLVVIGADSFTNDYGDESGVDEGEFVNQEVIDVMDDFIADKIWGSNGRLGKVLPSYGKGEIDDAINAGCGFVDFSGHGNPQVWSSHPHNSSKYVWIPTPTPPGCYSNSHAGDLSNGDELPILVIGGCSVLKYNSDSNCLGWSFVANPNGGGIASFGPTALGYAYIGSDVTYGLIERLSIDMFEAFAQDGALTVGEMWGKAITDYINKHTMQDADYKTVEEWQPFADPTLAIGEESQAPVKPDAPDGPDSGKINTEQTYTASTTDPDGDKISYMFDWGDGEFSGWIGPYNPGAEASASHTWTEQGDYEIRVKAKDDHGVQSEWSDPLPITMPKGKSYINPILLEILEKILERFPLLQQLLSTMPLIGAFLNL